MSGVVAFVTLTGRPEAIHDGAPPTSHCPLDAPSLRVPEPVGGPQV